MNLKEAFQFQNKLQYLINETTDILGDPGQVTKTEITYLKHKAASDETDETFVENEGSLYFQHVNELMVMLMTLLEEKGKLSAAIRDTKRNLPVDIDSETGLNAQRQNAARVFSRMSNLRSREELVRNGGTGYRFNADGNQISYRFDTKTVVTINFDRGKAKKYLTKLNKEASEVSNEIDRYLVNSEVLYETPFDVNDTFDDVFEHYFGTVN